MNVEWITPAQLDQACKRQEKLNLRLKQQSTTWVSMLYRVRDLIVEERESTIIIKAGWRELIKSIT